MKNPWFRPQKGENTMDVTASVRGSTKHQLPGAPEEKHMKNQYCTGYTGYTRMYLTKAKIRFRRKGDLFNSKLFMTPKVVSRKEGLE